jgi:hypothetical protein
MDPELILVVGRIIERLLVCLFAGLAILAGYKLFKVGIVDPQAADLRSKSFSLKLQKCGPGIFFGLFGTVILVMCLKDSLKVGSPQKGAKPDAPYIIDYLGLNDGPGSKDVCESINAFKNLGDPDTNGLMVVNRERTERLKRALATFEILKESLIAKRFGVADIAFYYSNAPAIRENSPRIPTTRLPKLKEIQQWMEDSVQ